MPQNEMELSALLTKIPPAFSLATHLFSKSSQTVPFPCWEASSLGLCPLFFFFFPQGFSKSACFAKHCSSCSDQNELNSHQLTLSSPSSWTRTSSNFHNVFELVDKPTPYCERRVELSGSPNPALSCSHCGPRVGHSASCSEVQLEERSWFYIERPCAQISSETVWVY